MKVTGYSDTAVVTAEHTSAGAVARSQLPVTYSTA